jgi:hypothetical protein
LVKLNVVDKVIEEKKGETYEDFSITAGNIRNFFDRSLKEVACSRKSDENDSTRIDELIEARYEKFSKMGRWRENVEEERREREKQQELEEAKKEKEKEKEKVSDDNVSSTTCPSSSSGEEVSSTTSGETQSENANKNVDKSGEEKPKTLLGGNNTPTEDDRKKSSSQSLADVAVGKKDASVDKESAVKAASATSAAAKPTASAASRPPRPLQLQFDKPHKFGFLNHIAQTTINGEHSLYKGKVAKSKFVLDTATKLVSQDHIAVVEKKGAEDGDLRIKRFR